MADKTVTFTHEQDLGPGVVRTPGYPVEDTEPRHGIADRRVDKDGNVADHPILSTYDGPVSPHVSVSADQPSDATAQPAPAQARLRSAAPTQAGQGQ